MTSGWRTAAGRTLTSLLSLSIRNPFARTHPEAQAAPANPTLGRMPVRLTQPSRRFPQIYSIHPANLGHSSRAHRCIDPKRDDVREYINVGDYVRGPHIKPRCIWALFETPQNVLRLLRPVWQYHRPGKSHQKEYGFPEWGDKPTTQFPNRMVCSWNTVVMWRTNEPKDVTELDEQALTAHKIMYGLVSV